LDQQKPAQDELITCPNESCRKVFRKPLKTLDFQASPEVYEACPHCLTRVSSTDKQTTINREEDVEISGANLFVLTVLGILVIAPKKTRFLMSASSARM
jgi:hypothetical protein